MAASGMLLLSQVSVKMKTQKSLGSHWVVNCSGRKFYLLLNFYKECASKTLVYMITTKLQETMHIWLAFKLAWMPTFFPLCFPKFSCFQCTSLENLLNWSKQQTTCTIFLNMKWPIPCHHLVAKYQAAIAVALIPHGSSQQRQILSEKNRLLLI